MDDREQGQKAAEAAIGNDPGQWLDEAAAQAEELFVGWCDANLDAGHWSKLAGVAPLEAAMLLCNLNPHEETQETAELASSDCTSGVDFKRLVSLFEDANRVDPSPRPLGDWLGIANVKGAKHHPWVGRYLSIALPVDATFAASDGADGSGTQQETVPRGVAQEREIIKKLRELGYDPLALPMHKPDKPGAKSAVRAALGTRGVWSGATVFTKAWARLKKDRAISYAP